MLMGGLACLLNDFRTTATTMAVYRNKTGIMEYMVGGGKFMVCSHVTSVFP